MQSPSHGERILINELLNQPSKNKNRFTDESDRELRRILFHSLAGQRDDYLRQLFPNGPPQNPSIQWSLRNAQGAVDGAEYTEAARGTACGHIFKCGESTYSCKTCAADDTCVLCARCFEASDHEGHTVFITVSPGNSGCCDCGDQEAWRREVKCTIHSAHEDASGSTKKAGKEKAVENLGASLPVDLVEAVRMTIARVVDYLCDVFSCSPEQLRLPKTLATIRTDERLSRLSTMYGDEPLESEPEFALILWNDEKHTVYDVENQVARACSQTKRFGFEKAMEVNDVGRSVIHHSSDVAELLRMAEIIEHLKLTVTIRSSRDTFREQMCATMIDWIADISGCFVGSDPSLLRNVVCEELLKPWRTGSHAPNRDIGQEGIDDHEIEDNERLRRQYRTFFNIPLHVIETTLGNLDDDDDDDENENEDGDGDDEAYMYEMDVDDDEAQMRTQLEVVNMTAAIRTALTAQLGDTNMDVDPLDDDEEGAAEAFEATIAGYPPPPPPPAPTLRPQPDRSGTPADSDEGDAEQQARPAINAPFDNVPKTPKSKAFGRYTPRASKHWLDKPEGFRGPRPSEPCEDLWQRVRLDFLILYDLRLWKTLRINLRHLYITTVVTIPHFRRILGLRFAGLYTTLAQLYLIADREPDHSIINLSVQMLTTPTITSEVVERGNFLANLMAILYTFLTTRQVGFPEDVNPRATLAFEAGAVANRRMTHFLLDLRWLFQSEFILQRMRIEPRYLLQFIDLVKIHQGVCPNVRATGEHVEYESDTWIHAVPIVKEINKLCKQVAVSFEAKLDSEDENVHLQRAVRTVARVTMINSFGYERKRFVAAELKDDLGWHAVGPFYQGGKAYSLPKHIVQGEPMSFHHPLHYLLSWLIENSKAASREAMRALLQFAPEDLKDPWNVVRGQPAPSDLTSDELLSSIFEHPLRVCVWLAQMKTTMWVRNGITLRHQAHNYKSVAYRDIGYQRDIFMIQAGLVLCGSDSELPGERFLAQMIDRFQMAQWFTGDYSLVTGFEESQQLDVIEEFFHLLIVALSERGNLYVSNDDKEQHDKVLQHDIAHALCFKPLSFSELAARITEKIGDSDDFDRVLNGMTNFRSPEGLNDSGTFELKPEYVDMVNPYYAHYSRNQREEADQMIKRHIAKTTGKKLEDVIYEPKLQPIPVGLFKCLSYFTSTPLFVQVVAVALRFAVEAKDIASKVQSTRIETFLHIVLHLVLIATIEDEAGTNGGGFVKLATTPQNVSTSNEHHSVVSALVALSSIDEYSSCHAAAKHILRKMQTRQPEKMLSAIGPAGILLDRAVSGSPASLSADEKERKKQEALARQARVMAKMKEQQNSFLANQGLSGVDDSFDDLDDMSITEEPESIELRKTWNFPTGNCIWCQEETDEQRLYGTFAFLGESNILRSTPLGEHDFISEVIDVPENLDRPAEHLRPFGVAGQNKHVIQKLDSAGHIVNSERQGLSRGFPHQYDGVKAPIATGCGHIMHFSCFELYLAHSFRRHTQQIARNHPENIELKEFTCPLCKALGNTFLPIIWKTKECAQEHELHAARGFDDWLLSTGESYAVDTSVFKESSTPTATTATTAKQQQMLESYSTRSLQYINHMCAPSLLASMNELSLEDSPTDAHQSQRYAAGRGYMFTRLFTRGRSDGSQSSADGTGFSPQGENPPRVSELAKAYYRIDETVRTNKLCEETNDNPVGPLSRALGLSISAYEISHRGVGNNPLATSLLTDLPEQTVTHFRVLSETIQSYLAIKSLRPTSRSSVARDTIMKQEMMTAQLFCLDEDYLPDGETLTAFLEDDVFMKFVDWLSYMAPDVAEATNILQLCYWAEVTKVIMAYAMIMGEGFHVPSKEVTGSTPNADKGIPSVISTVLPPPGTPPYGTGDQRRHTYIYHLVRKYALTFLRKSIIAMYVRYGLDFECPYDLESGAPELQRLTSLLHLRPLDDMFALFTSSSAAGEQLRQLTHQWARPMWYVEGWEIGIPFIGHPGIFELVGLPKHYDTLTEEAIKRRCPTTGKEVTDPAICLLCGDIFCSQGVCCTKGKNMGGCNQHMRKHDAKIGLFLIVRKCTVLFLHGYGNGSFVNAPYLDKHGETDPTLRRRHPLFLNTRRYDKLMREVWLQHQIPTVISRKLEADVNPGGWDTM